MPTFLAAELVSFSRKLFVAASVPEADAETVALHLVDANLCGHDSHGVMRVPQYIQFLREGKYRAGVELTLLHETPAALSADANWGLGQVQAHRLLDKLLQKAESLGVAIGTLRNCGHAGRLGAYAEVAASKKMALFATVNSHGAGRRVAPPGGTEGRISTNPICMGAPTASDPVVLDFGTSVAAEGKVRVHHQKSIPVPDGWLLDHAGLPTNDPSVLYQEPTGTIRPFGGQQSYKGFGLGLLLDMFAGGLSGGNCSNPNFPMAGMGNALVFIVINPACLGGTEHFLAETTGLAEFVRSSKPAPGIASITLPGDPERISRELRLKTGIEIPDGTWGMIVKAAETLGVELLK